MTRSIEQHERAVRDLMADGARRPPAQRVVLDDASGRVLAEDVRAPLDLPALPNSQMDGFAVATADLEERAGGARTLRVAAIQPAGARPVAHTPGTATAVMTGAVLPGGADAVIPVERVEPATFDTPEITVTAAEAAETAPGRYVRPAGSDVTRGAVALPAGTLIGPAALGACAALGFTGSHPLPVRRGPHVLVISGGDEVVAPGEDLRPGTVYDANGALLAGWFAGAGAASVRRLRVNDNLGEFVDALERTVTGASPDLMVTSGGISAGAFEVVRVGLQRVAEMWFGHVAVQPGGPQGCGSYRGIPVLCLPGNPVSTWVSCEIFVRPALADVWGCCGASQWFTAVLAEPVRQMPGRVQLRRGVLEAGPAAGPALEPVVRCEGGPSSHLLMSAARATVLLRIPEGTGPLPSGTRVAVLPVTGGTAQQTGARP